MPESVQDRCTRSHEYIFLLTKKEKYFYNNEAIKERALDGSLKNKKDVWCINPSRFKGAHFATYPPELVKNCILAGSREGDLVLDNTAGSGTTGVACINTNRKFIGYELDEKYFEIARQRLEEQLKNTQ
jgi:DNA modification methylase